jgi:hypothetical protein
MEEEFVGIEPPVEAQETHQAGYNYEDDGDHTEQKYNKKPK